MVKNIHKWFITAAEDGLLDKYMSSKTGEQTDYQNTVGKQTSHSWSMFKENMIPINEKLNIIVQESQLKLNMINEAYDNILALSYKIDKNIMEEGYQVGTKDFYEHVKYYIENSATALEELRKNLKEVYKSAYDVLAEFPDLANDISTTIEPMLTNIIYMPEKLKALMSRVRKNYNPKSAFGI